MKKVSTLILFISILTGSIQSQTATGTITKVPCNNDGIFTVSVSGLTPPLTYNYYVNGQSITHSNVNSTTDQLTNIAMGTWSWMYCNVTDGSSYAYANASYTPSFVFNFSSKNPVCPATMGTLTATRSSGSTGPFSYLWTNKQTLTTYSGNNVTVPIGEYGVKITDQTTGCVLEVIDSAASVQQLSNVKGNMSATKASCTNGTAAVIPSGGVAPYTYLWANGATTSSISGLTQGVYTVEVTDAQGCKSNNLRVWVQQDPRISVQATVTNATCLQSDGKIIAFGSGGVNPYTYKWSDGQTGNTAQNLSGGTSITVIATDANGCTGLSGRYVGYTTPINVTYTTTASSCTTSNGSATLSMTGGTAPYSVVWNTSPAATGTTLSNVSPGTYSFKVTDAVGCVRNGTAVVPSTSTINVGIGSTPALCPNSNGTATVSVSGTHPPFTYKWSNGATTNRITGLTAGNYSCEITDANGCSVKKFVIVRRTSPVFVSVSAQPASCIFNKDGSATSTVRGGTPPYTYRYTSGSTSANASGLGVGDYWLTVTDANGCSSSRHFWIRDAKTTDNCYCTITGTVYHDANSNCVQDGGETGIENIMIHCSGYGYRFTDSKGEYSFKVPSGSYTIKEQVNAYYPLASCQSTSKTVSVVAASACSTTVDFANDIKVIHDLKLRTLNNTIPPVPGYNYKQKVVVTNRGTVTESGVQMGYVHDGQLPLSSSTLSSFVQLNKTGAPYAWSVQSGYPTLKANESSSMILTYATPTNIPINTGVVFYDTVAHKAPIDPTWKSDYSPWNNVNTYNTTVVGSYDPNYKEVSPIGEGEEGYITEETVEFDYTIHFQNEGTYFARNIYITDQLDEDFDWTTFKPGYSDYEYTVEISEDGLVTFTFADINLPWKDGYGDVLSSGLVSYSIDRKSKLPKGTEFTNTADIYFDFNPPITTNTTLNTLSEDTEVGGVEISEDISREEITMELFPVPTKDFITIRLNGVAQNASANLKVIDLIGNVVMMESIPITQGSNQFQQNVSNLSRGTYLALIQLDNGNVLTKKMILY